MAFLVNEITIIIILLFVSYIISIILLVKSQRYRRKSNKKKFFKVLIKGLENELINTFDDLLNLHVGSLHLNSINTHNRLLLNKHLKEFLVILVFNNKEYMNNKIEYEKIKKFKEIITKFIDENNKKSPYSDLPIIEKTIFDDLLILTEKKDFESINRKIIELSNLFKIRIRDSNKNKNFSIVSVLFGAFGLILTLIIGFL